MIAKNNAQLKSWIKNMSAKVEINENIILQNYILERLLDSGKLQMTIPDKPKTKNQKYTSK